MTILSDFQSLSMTKISSSLIKRVILHLSGTAMYQLFRQRNLNNGETLSSLPWLSLFRSFSHTLSRKLK